MAAMIKLPEGEIHLWVVRDKEVQDPALLDRYRAFLNEEEARQHRRFIFDRHRHQYLVTRALIRSTLSAYCPEVAPPDWRFAKNPYGRPHAVNLPKGRELHFNLSHAEGLVVAALSTQRAMGVDVEIMDRKVAVEQLAQRFFSFRETEDLLDLGESKQAARFFDLWTLKEAYIKACGMGLSIPLDQFSFIFPEPGKIDIQFSAQREDQPDQWRFWQLEAGPEYKLALGIKAEAGRGLELKGRIGVPLSGFESWPCQVLRTKD